MKPSRMVTPTPERVARFWEKVTPSDPRECWEWSGEKHTTGHGIYREWSGNRVVAKVYAHRLSLVIAGIDVAGLVVRHDCDNPPCVNPAHLRAGTQADNVRDAIERGRMNSDGLAMGRTYTYPPRPCWRCGATVSEGRKRYCPDCKRAIVRERSAQARERHRMRGVA